MDIKQLLFQETETLTNIGLLIIRAGVGLTFIKHGWRKVTRGYDEWLWTGQQMKYLGINFWPVFWGLCATAAEFLGGIALTLGLGTRIAAFFLAFTMFVATIHHIGKGDSWGYISFPLALLFVFSGFLIAGGGLYSLDHYFYN